MAIADAFVGLPIESLILDPLLSAAKVKQHSLK